ISPWNFPLAIFTGQVAAALAAGNAVLAKPAGETPLIAAWAVRLLHEAGVPPGALHLLPGGGEVGARLVSDARVRGVIFTGSTEVARSIQATLARRLDARGRPIPLIAETGGQNAMVVDSSALPEQAVADIIASAFDSAGQRCSAARILLVQEDIAPGLLAMLKGAMAELRTGNPDRLSTDTGPVITARARDGILAHIQAMAERGRAVFQAPLAGEAALGSFVPPTLIEIESIAELGREVFGPVLHVLPYRRGGLDKVIGGVNALGYGLTFGIHSRIDETIARASALIEAGNIYVNRNIIGAVVGVQPFGGFGRSGTGPKAGGPLYLGRLLSVRPRNAAPPRQPVELPGPVGEQNSYRLEPRGAVLCRAASAEGLARQVEAALASGNAAHLSAASAHLLDALPEALRAAIRQGDAGHDLAAALFEGDGPGLIAFQEELARRPGPVISVFTETDGFYPLEYLLRERVVSVNTAAAGGNASLMTIG
ncbi:MAG TPA: L-glutamate gamma-semialdehyde dehydrogenase, partial [Acetobacteraceae bacterium]|nr:L-glutamate gamma-semialdehyde dehydrogenase [Acetobacteraceae bacterium]